MKLNLQHGSGVAILHSRKLLLAGFAQDRAEGAVSGGTAVQGTQRLTRTSRALLHKKNRDRYTGKSVSCPVSVLSAACTRAKPARESRLSILTRDCGALASIEHAAVHVSFGELQWRGRLQRTSFSVGAAPMRMSRVRKPW